jgi:hypothetical protein
VLNGTIASAFADSGATSHVGTKKDRDRQAFIATGRQSDKAFRMPNGSVEEATALDALQHNLRAPARDIHIVPSIERDSLLSVSKFIDANYIAIFDKDEVKIFDANNTEITVSRAAILRGWRCPDTKLWRIPLVKHVTNANTDTILCDRPPSEFLPERPPPTEAVANVYELKTQPELIRYYHAAVGFPTKPTWVTAIKNRQFASWPGLTAKPLNIFQNPRRPRRVTDKRREAGCDRPRKLEAPTAPTTTIMMRTPFASIHHPDRQRERAKSSTPSTTSKMKCSLRCTPTRRDGFQRIRAEETSTSWY